MVFVAGGEPETMCGPTHLARGLISFRHQRLSKSGGSRPGEDNRVAVTNTSIILMSCNLCDVVWVVYCVSNHRFSVCGRARESGNRDRRLQEVMHDFASQQL